MVVQFSKWGNSVALRIPNAFAKEIRAGVGTSADVTVQDGKLIVAPVEIPVYDLAELVSRITDENRHGEISGHYAVGNEFAG
jgi:antitoxin MazE